MNDISWTSHAEYKMKFYRLSKQKVSGVIRRPDRIEKGIAGGNTVAVMQAVSPKVKDGKRFWNQEIWTLYKEIALEKSDDTNKDGFEVRKQFAPSPKAMKSAFASSQIIKNDNTKNMQNEIVERIARLQNELLSVRNLRVISAWRYPGMSPKNKPLPDDILLEIEEMTLA
jgi:uncharacterized protein YcbK (DUF882 family)